MVIAVAPGVRIFRANVVNIDRLMLLLQRAEVVPRRTQLLPYVKSFETRLSAVRADLFQLLHARYNWAACIIPAQAFTVKKSILNVEHATVIILTQRCASGIV